MTRFWSRIAAWSSLYEPVLIYESSHRSVFVLPVYLVHNGHKFESPVTEFGSHERVCNRYNMPRHQTHEFTHNIHTHSYTHLHIHTHYTYIHYIALNTLTLQYINSYVHSNTYNTLVHTHTHTRNHAYTQAYTIRTRTCIQHTL